MIKACLLLCVIASAGAAELTLPQALREALDRNSGYQAFRNDVQFADVTRDSVWGGYFPTVTTNAGYGRSWLNTFEERTGAPSLDQNGALTISHTAGINADWTLFQGFSTPLAQKRLGLLFEQAKDYEGMSREDVVNRTVLAYADLARQIRLYRALDTTAEISEERMRILEHSLAAGAVSRSDWLTGRVDRNADQAALRRQEAALQSARMVLGQVLGRDKPVTEDVDSVALSDSSLDLESLLRDLPEHRPDLKLAETNRALAEVITEQRATVWLPKLDALAGYNFDLTNTDPVVTQTPEVRTLGPSVGLQLNFNLFTGEFPWHAYHRARIALTSAELRQREALTSAEAELMQDYAVFRGADSALILEREALGYAQENLGLTFTRWKSGSISYIEARQSQEQYLNTFTLVENTSFDALNERLQLLRAAGQMETLLDSNPPKTR